MPRVTDQHRERRRQQILDAARRCFARRGFHQTTMSDILHESELSAGAVYGYFRGKDEIIAAIAQGFVGETARLIEPVAQSETVPPLPDVLDSLLGHVEEAAFGPDGFAYIAPQIWAEALHNEPIRELFRSKYAEIIGAFARLVAAQQSAGHIDPDADPDTVARVVLGSVFGYILQRVVLGVTDRAAFRDGLAAIVRASRPPSPEGTTPGVNARE